MAIEYNTISKTIKWFKDLSTKNELEKVICYNGISLWFLVEDYVKNKNLSRAIIKIDKRKIILNFAKLNFAKYYITSRVITRFILGKIITKRIKNKHLENNTAYKILALSYTNYWKKYPTPQKEGEKVCGDTMLGDIITTLKNKNFNIVALDTDTTFFIDFETMIKKRVREKELWRPVEGYLTLDILGKAFKASKKHKEEWDKLKNNKEFIDSLNEDYDGFQMSDLLKDYFERLFKYEMFLPILSIELMKRAIEVEKPDLVLMTCAPTLIGRAATIAGKLKGVPTLEIQHGVIGPYYGGGYIFAKEEIADDDGATVYYSIVDKIAVYGPYYKELLTKVRIHPEDGVVVTGQPRYDILFYADKIYSKEKFFKKYKINSNHKIILWTTQCLIISDEENIKNFKAVFGTMQNIKDVTLVIKQHPEEGKRYTRIIKNYLNKYKIDVVITQKSSDTYEQLFVCDLMITRHSTTAMEAVALNKPVIILNLSGEPDPVEYVKEGVALGVYKEKDLKPAIEKLLKDDSELAINRERYIEKYLYKMDGKATERVVNLITQIIEGRKRTDKS